MATMLQAALCSHHFLAHCISGAMIENFCSLNIVQTFGGVYNIHCNVKEGQCVLKSIFLSFTPFFWALPAPKKLS